MKNSLRLSHLYLHDSGVVLTKIVPFLVNKGFKSYQKMSITQSFFSKYNLFKIKEKCVSEGF